MAKDKPDNIGLSWGRGVALKGSSRLIDLLWLIHVCADGSWGSKATLMLPDHESDWLNGATPRAQTGLDALVCVPVQFIYFRVTGGRAWGRHHHRLGVVLKQYILIFASGFCSY